MPENEPKETSRRPEIAAIISLIAVFMYVELQFHVFSAIGVALSVTLPGFNTLAPALFVGGFIGLCTYSIARRREFRAEMERRISIEQDYELSKICDKVTGLPNAYAFQLVLESKLNEDPRRPLTLLCLEVANLDVIASVHGQESAEGFEVALANEISSRLGPSDFAARGEGSIFHVYASGGTVDENRFRIDTLIEDCVAFCSSGSNTVSSRFQASLTFGVLDIEEHSYVGADWDAASILRRVDFARHRARRRGNQAVEIFDQRMETAMRERAMIESSLSAAIRGHQIIPHFHPLVDLRTHQIIGAESLARWNHETLGPVSPEVFIQIAEEIGALRLLTLSMLQQSCMAARNWPDHVKLSINVSPTDLRDPDVAQKFTSILNETGVAPERIEIEITENAFIEEAGQISGAINTLKDLGMSIAIDDFGTGYSSLHHLRILPFDKIKIDQSFVRDMATNPESRAIVQSVVAMATGLGLTTTAEGIETTENEALLADLGCAIGQGYLYAKPMPADEMMTFIANNANGWAPREKVA